MRIILHKGAPATAGPLLYCSKFSPKKMSLSNSSPLSSIQGKIEHLLITLPPSADEYVDQYYQELVSTFSDREKVIRYRNYEPPRHPSQKINHGLLKEMNLEEQLHTIIRGREVLSFFGEEDFYYKYVGDLIEFLKEGTPIANTEWAQDPFSVLESKSGSTILLQPLFSNRYMDKFISLSLVANHELGLDALIKPTDLLIEGGNVLAGKNFILAGKDLLAQNILRQLKKERGAKANPMIVEEMENRFHAAYGCDHVIWVGFDRAVQNWKQKKELTYQPAFHIDLFITFGGIDESGKHLLFQGDPTLSLELLRDKVSSDLLISPPSALEQFGEMKQFWDSYHATRKPEMPSFNIIPLPLFIYGETIYSYNNCLVEAFDDQKIAYLPNYLVTPEEDQHAQLNPVFEILQKNVADTLYNHGFTKVVWIGPGKFFRTLCLMRGSLHCITKVLKRK